MPFFTAIFQTFYPLILPKTTETDMEIDINKKPSPSEQRIINGCKTVSRRFIEFAILVLLLWVFQWWRAESPMPQEDTHAYTMIILSCFVIDSIFSAFAAGMEKDL
jgi:hypothetical protein